MPLFAPTHLHIGTRNVRTQTQCKIESAEEKVDALSLSISRKN